jgi:hypothetical protein
MAAFSRASTSLNKRVDGRVKPGHDVKNDVVEKGALPLPRLNDRYGFTGVNFVVISVSVAGFEGSAPSST